MDLTCVVTSVIIFSILQLEPVLSSPEDTIIFLQPRGLLSSHKVCSTFGSATNKQKCGDMADK